MNIKKYFIYLRESRKMLKHIIMRVYLCFLLLFVSFQLCFGERRPTMSFCTKTGDFGAIKYRPKSMIKIKFYYRNTGNAPLVIYNVIPSCGCIVPNWTKKPISVGVRDSILINYKYSEKGMVNKSVFIEANTKEKITILYIKGYIL
jgi:hypothetical protein